MYFPLLFKFLMFVLVQFHKCEPGLNRSATQPSLRNKIRVGQELMTYSKVDSSQAVGLCDVTETCRKE